MRAGCRISTNGELLHTLTMSPTSEFLWPAIAFLTDSKRLNRQYGRNGTRQKSRVLTSLTNGLERAFTEMPASVKVFHPEAARREL
jgi:hypothetical protein